ncbi:hypothetical protein KKG72_07200 [bacterium]|nr:hypothetical protein [bacterium]MBU1994033.1 hypothetical protein [bacterium]
MDKLVKILGACALLLTALMAQDKSMELPSSVPIDVFEMQENQIGVGFMQFNVNLSLEDEYYGDKIGDAEYKNQGIIITLPANTETIIGKMFELSYTLGVINSELKDKVFTDGGNIYNNTYSKNGFYVGIRPSFSVNLYESDMFKIKNATSLHAVLYTMSGDFSVNNNNGPDYAYDETSYGIGLKPSTVLSGTFYPVNNFGITMFGGLSTFLALNVTDFTNKNTSLDADTEAAAYMSSIDPIYGFDVIYRGIFSEYDSFNLSSVFAMKENDTAMETIVRYVFTF